MHLRIIGSGDAFGSGGRHNTCFHLATAGRSVLIDCGASAPVALRAQGVVSLDSVCHLDAHELRELRALL